MRLAILAMSLLAIVMSLASVAISIAAKRRYNRALNSDLRTFTSMDPNWTPPSASLNPAASLAMPDLTEEERKAFLDSLAGEETR